MMRVAFLGLGIMGSRMAANVARAGFELVVWNRTTARAQELGMGRVADSPADAAAGADVVVTMVVDGPQVEQVLLGPGGAAGTAGPDTVFVDCSTIGVAAAQKIGAQLAHFVDAPVTGSAPRAQDGTLTIMAGGSERDFERVRAVLEAMGKLVLHVGPLGHGQMVKLINNAVAATNAAVVAQALLVGARAGLDLDALTRVMAAGSGSSAMLELKAGPMREHDYTPLFKLDHMLKDVRLCLEEADIPFEHAALTRELLEEASGQGFGEADFAALIEALEARTGTRL